ncbi:Nucleotide-binding universal stress protein, UspA family [Roseovarius pacificus]|uniref:Nucleotide-binding universal stress protein, UspA family n=1 Tax=Roseovarius pacificus TaxID=337701 RepID=A0A1M6X203_9RHOB|nr:universal stress protein [Roseovarius pacificus]GGO52661.1 universal stress protein UspA [Roseovarius pacificus]SHK99966.1 Nucleotide-binding universal stress protein, UspA family [Roseovarius pacificus]
MTGPVLCAVDVSNPHRDDNVLRAAARLAALDDAQLDVITVVPDYGMSVVGSYFEKGHHEKAVEEARSLLRELVADVLGAEANETVRHIVATGNAYDEILRVAGTDKASLIVIGAHKPDFKDYLLGPNAARVVRHSNCSVFVVR